MIVLYVGSNMLAFRSRGRNDPGQTIARPDVAGMPPHSKPSAALLNRARIARAMRNSLPSEGAR
jgi:hypothetical protein